MSANNLQHNGLNTHNVFPVFYHFDVNNRVYEKEGIKTLCPVYEKHFVEIKILEENDKEYICKYGRTINKKSMLYKINSSARVRVFTEQEKEDDIYKKIKSHILANIVRESDSNTLRKIEQTLCSIKNITILELYK